MKNFTGKPSVVLFSLRLFFYLSVISLIFIHPGIAVTFDHIGITQWFVIVPVMALLAFVPDTTRSLRKKFLFAFLILLVLSVTAGRFSTAVFAPFIAGFISFTFTFLLFHHPRMPLLARLAKITLTEPFFFAWICLRLLSLSRSGEDIAGQSMILTQFILVWTAVVFLLHSAVIYFCLYPKSYVKAWKEGIIIFCSALAVLIVMLVVLPPDFVRNTVIVNLLSDRIPERIGQDSERGLPQRGSGRRTLPIGEDGQPGLRGLPEHSWHGRGGGSSEENRQYMIKIVASDREPVYMGNSFRGRLDSIEGFLLSPQEHLNDLTRQRFFVTWFNNERTTDLGRQRQEVFSLSTLQQKYIPWLPVSIDPIILNENAGPLRFIHQVVSNTHFDDPLFLVNTPSRPFSEREKSALAHYLEIPLDDNDKEIFTVYLNNALQRWQDNRDAIIRSDRYLWKIFSSDQSENDTVNLSGSNEYLETIIALLVNFNQYQYNLNSDDTHSIAALKEFVLNSQEGDCVEFSNTLALLGRLAGIPSRVVTGYLAAEGLQTVAHLRGLAALRARIPVLQQFPFDNLYMVTNLHSHSWTQFYIPDYGWLDFEATIFAQPPIGMGDFNNWDVVIPLLDEDRTFSQIRKFPWQAVGRTVVFLLILAVVCAYTLRYGRELFLYISAQRRGRTGARSLYLLLLARLAADGQPIKPASKTAHEYSQLFPGKTSDHFKHFADTYSELRWRNFNDPAEADNKFLLLKQQYNKILSQKNRNPLHCIKRILSLRGLAYL